MENGILKAYGAVRGMGKYARDKQEVRDSYKNLAPENRADFFKGERLKSMRAVQSGSHEKEFGKEGKLYDKRLKSDRKKLNRKTRVENRMGRYEEEDEDFERSNGPNRPRKRKSEYDEMGKHSKTHITPTENLKNKKRKNKLGNSAIFSGADTINFTNNNDGTETVKAMGASAEDIKTAYGKVMLNA